MRVLVIFVDIPNISALSYNIIISRLMWIIKILTKSSIIQLIKYWLPYVFFSLQYLMAYKPWFLSFRCFQKYFLGLVFKVEVSLRVMFTQCLYLTQPYNTAIINTVMSYMALKMVIFSVTIFKTMRSQFSWCNFLFFFFFFLTRYCFNFCQMFFSF